MPYFKNNKFNILYLHIPKTGGSTIEKYLSMLFRTNINIFNLFSANVNKFRKYFYGSPQHQRLCTLLKYRKAFNIKLKNLFIFASVRNPYNRAISDLFFLKLINKNSSKEFVYNILKKFVHAKNKFDNHNLPQYLYFTNYKGKFNKKIKIVKNENLNEDMLKLGFRGFNKIQKKKQGKVSSEKYINYLNKDSINLINKVYHKDFVFFNYKKITFDIKNKV